MPIPDLFGKLALGFVLRVGSHFEDAESLLPHRLTRGPLSSSDEERASNVDAQQSILAKDRHADLERFQLPAAGIQQHNREKHFALDLVNSRHIQLLDQPPQLLGRFVALQADGSVFLRETESDVAVRDSQNFKRMD